MTPEELKIRTKAFAVRVIRLVDALPRSLAAQVVARGPSGNHVLGDFSNRKPFVSDADVSQRGLSGWASRQLLRSATSVGANYRAACRAQSRAEFAAKLSIVVEEADETLYWLELLHESGLVKPESLTDLIREADELVAITLASRKTAKSEPVRR